MQAADSGSNQSRLGTWDSAIRLGTGKKLASIPKPGERQSEQLPDSIEATYSRSTCKFRTCFLGSWKRWVLEQVVENITAKKLMYCCFS